MSRSESLYHLQRIDSQLDGHHRRLQEIKVILEDDRAVKAVRAKYDSADELLQEAHKDLRNAKARVQDQRAKIAQSEDRLYSGKVGNPKELEDIQNEVAALKRYLDVVEERQLECMLSVDEAQANFDDAQGHLDQAIADSESRNADLLQEKSGIDTSVAELEIQRQERVSGIAADDLKLYESLRSKRAGVAVAKVQDRDCTACGTGLASAIYQQARSPSKITQCDACGRILYAE
ncbi:MAG: hypothetical protein FJ010_11545 [Chloroflexi bacterium]|nr:hypothetical protein [Chloroflexota bacterium]